jgi:PAB-dependent poly(A)-specific ribonuclease subunit 2
MPIVQQLFGMQVKTISRCQCQHETSRTTWPYSIDLVYPKKVSCAHGIFN